MLLIIFDLFVCETKAFNQPGVGYEIFSARSLLGLPAEDPADEAKKALYILVAAFDILCKVLEGGVGHGDEVGPFPWDTHQTSRLISSLPLLQNAYLPFSSKNNGKISLRRIPITAPISATRYPS